MLGSGKAVYSREARVMTKSMTAEKVVLTTTLLSSFPCPEKKAIVIEFGRGAFEGDGRTQFR